MFFPGKTKVKLQHKEAWLEAGYGGITGITVEKKKTLLMEGAKKKKMGVTETRVKQNEQIGVHSMRPLVL